MPEKEYKEMVEDDRKNASSMVAEWTRKLEEATTQLKYWKLQEEALRTVSTRLMFDGWQKKSTA